VSEWAVIEPMLVEQAEGVINNDPSVLLEQDGGPVGMTADVILARLFGFDEQVDHDWRVRRVEPVLLAPIRDRVTVMVDDDPYMMPRVAEYRLQSNYATLSLDARYAPADVIPGPQFIVSVLFVRYRRK
jgi:hypothetical protein